MGKTKAGEKTLFQGDCFHPSLEDLISFWPQEALAEVRAEMQAENEEEDRRRRKSREGGGKSAEDEDEHEKGRRRRSRQAKGSRKNKDSLSDSNSSQTRTRRQPSNSKKDRVKVTKADVVIDESIAEEILVDNSMRTEEEEEEVETEELPGAGQTDYEQDFESVTPSESDGSSRNDTMS